MAAIASFVLPDGLATPVNHTFTPILQEGRFSEWRDKALAISLAWPSVSVQHTVDDLKSPVFRVKSTIVIPTMEALSSASSGITPGPTLAYSTKYISEYIIPRRATLQERKDIVAYAGAWAGGSVLQLMITNLDVPY